MRLATNERWLLPLAEANDWWLPSRLAHELCERLGIEMSEPEYYRAIYIWLPDVRWGAMAMPSCVTCAAGQFSCVN